MKETAKFLRPTDLPVFWAGHKRPLNDVTCLWGHEEQAGIIPRCLTCVTPDLFSFCRVVIVKEHKKKVGELSHFQPKLRRVTAQPIDPE